MLIWNEPSRIPPNTSARITGGRGQPPRFMKNPSMPKNVQLTQSPTEAPPSQAPM